jgi:hypothetical protein
LRQLIPSLHGAESSRRFGFINVTAVEPGGYNEIDHRHAIVSLRRLINTPKVPISPRQKQNICAKITSCSSSGLLEYEKNTVDEYKEQAPAAFSREGYSSLFSYQCFV